MKSGKQSMRGRMPIIRSIQIGAALSFPLGNISARNRLKASKVAKEQLVLGYRKLQQDVLVEVDTNLSALETDNFVIQARVTSPFSRASLPLSLLKVTSFL